MGKNRGIIRKKSSKASTPGSAKKLLKTPEMDYIKQQQSAASFFGNHGMSQQQKRARLLNCSYELQQSQHDGPAMM